MTEKVRLEAITLSNRQNLMADEIFQSGQSILSGIKQKTRNVDDRRTENIQKLKDRRAEDFENVMNKVEESLAAEEERKLVAVNKTTDNHMNFLQRLEEQSEFKNHELKAKFDKVAEKTSDTKERQSLIKDTKARNIRIKMHMTARKHDGQVKDARDRNNTHVSLQAEKRRLFREGNTETNDKIKMLNREIGEIKLKNYEQKSKNIADFSKQCQEAQKVVLKPVEIKVEEDDDKKQYHYD